MTTDGLRGVPAVEFIAAEREAAEWLYPEPQYDSLTYPHGAVRGYMRVAFIKGALWRAAQQPTWQAIREAVEASLHDTFPDHDLSPHDIFHIADAVLALYENGDEQ